MMYMISCEKCTDQWTLNNHPFGWDEMLNRQMCSSCTILVALVFGVSSCDKLTVPRGRRCGCFEKEARLLVVLKRLRQQPHAERPVGQHVCEAYLLTDALYARLDELEIPRLAQT